MFRRQGLALCAVVLIVGGCGGGESKPSEDKLAAVFASKHSPFGMPLPPKKADCMAQAYRDSGLSAEYLNALTAGQPPGKVSQSDQNSLDDLSATISRECLTD